MTAKLKLMLLLILLQLPVQALAATITKTYTNNVSGGVDGKKNGGLKTISRTLNVPASDFPVGAIINDVRINIGFEKLDGGTNKGEAGRCALGHQGGDAFNDEIYFALDSPAGTSIILVDEGDYSDQTTYGGAVSVTFDDSGTVLSAFPQSGSYAPAESLANFDGESSIGDWTLTIGDNLRQDPVCYSSSTLTVVMTVPDPDIDFVITSSSVAENVGTHNLAVQIEYAIDQDITLDYSFAAASTAILGTDYSDPNSGSFVISGGADTILDNIPLTIIDDNWFEPDETIVVDLESASNAVLATNVQHTVTILANDANADISITKTDSSSTYSPGGNSTYIITVSNLGPNSVAGVAVNDTIPPEASSATWTCTAAGSAVCGTASGSGDISSVLVDIPFGDSVEFEVSVTWSTTP